MMDRLRFETTESPTIHIKSIQQSLRIKGWDREEIRADGDIGNSLNIIENGDSFSVQSNHGCMLRVPYSSTLIIDKVEKDIQLKNLGGEISIKTVNGQVHIKNTNGLKIDTVNGDIFCGQIDGNLLIKNGAKNATFKNIEGHLKINQLIVYRKAELSDTMTMNEIKGILF